MLSRGFPATRRISRSASGFGGIAATVGLRPADPAGRLQPLHKTPEINFR